MSVSPLHLATYGTLMQAFGGCSRLGIADRVSVVGTCCFEGVLYDLGSFPGAVPGENIVYGELLRLHDPRVWSILDQYEGYDADREADSLFVRRQVDLRAPPERAAWVYWFNGRPDGERIASGDWARYNGGSP